MEVTNDSAVTLPHPHQHTRVSRSVVATMPLLITRAKLTNAVKGGLAGTVNADRVEAPVTLKAYLLCVFASFGGIFFG